MESEEIIKQVWTKSIEAVRITRIKYLENPYTYIDVRFFSRGYDDEGEEEFYPTKKGIHMKEEDYVKLVKAHFFQDLDKQIENDPRG